MNLQVAVAIALAESGGNTTARANTSREDSRGLWQINVRAHPEFASANLYDPAVNARAAKAVHAKQGFDAWSVWKPQGLNPRYLLYMPTAGAAVSSLPLSADTGMIGEGTARDLTPLDELEQVGEGVQVAVQVANKLNQWVTTPANWLRVMYVVIGGGLVLVGIAVAVVPIARDAIKTANKVRP
jgi:Lysozyme like domain